MPKQPSGLGKVLEGISIEEILANLPGHAYWKDVNGVYLGCNDLQACDLGLKSRQEIVGKTDFDFSPLKEALFLKKNDQKVIETNKVLLIEELGYLSIKSPLHNNKGQIIGILGVSIDIREYKEAIFQENQILDEIIALMPGHVYWKDRNCILQGCNQQQAQDVGLKSRREIVGKTAYDLVYPNQSEEIKREQARLTDEIDKKIMDSGISETIEEFAINFENKKIDYISQKAPLHDRNGNVVGLVGMSIDVTERKKIEEALKNAQGQIDGMTLVSASIAHELRTPLAGVKSALYSINSYLPKLIQAYYQAVTHKLDVPMLSENVLQSLQDATTSINKKVDHSNMVIDMLLTNLAHKQINTGGFTQCSIADCVQQAIEKYSFATGQKKLVKNKVKQDFSFRGKSTLILHVLFNLFKNALYFIQKVGKGEIHIWTELGEHTHELHVKDTSQGIAPEFLPHVFDQFFSKGTHHGTGIGLAFSKMVMQAHGGDITCKSVYGEYAEFILSFPVTTGR